MNRALPIVACAVFAVGGCNQRVTLGSRDEPDGGTHFATLPPGAALPSGAECASLVPHSGFEPRPENAAANHTLPTAAELATFRAESWVAVDERAKTVIRQRIDGAFTGTTDEIITWAACKWGFDDDLLRAAAVASSNWRQAAEAGVYAGDCPPDITPAQDGSCPHLFGLFAVNYDAEDSAHTTWPELRSSTAFNADYMGGFLRMCFEGYVSWLDSPEVTPENGAPYVAGDDWGCLGFAASGRWKNAPAQSFTTRVHALYDARPWLAAGF